jgi:hypothetical protein
MFCVQVGAEEGLGCVVALSGILKYCALALGWQRQEKKAEGMSLWDDLRFCEFKILEKKRY